MNKDYIVGIGASAGGLEAIETFFDHMPSETGLSFVIVQHLSPDYESLMVELLSNRVEMIVERVEDKADGIDILPDHIYLIPPKKNMIIQNRRLFLMEQDRSHGFHLPIDVFFESLAGDQRDKSIGVILSGTGSDGKRGIKSMKESGGRIFVQSPESSKFDGMPQSAISTGLVDHILPAEDLAKEIIQYINAPISQSLLTTEVLTDSSTIKEIIELIRENTNTDFSGYKMGTIARRISRRMSLHQLQNLPGYLQYLIQNPREITLLQNDIFIGVTKFFRDPDAFRILQEEVFPKLVKNRSSAGMPIRIWVAGCSTGEEAYSIAILLQEYMRMLDENIQLPDVKIFATDIDPEAIEFASAGIYSDSSMSDIDPHIVSRYFTKEDNLYKVKRNIRETIIFAKHNIINDPPFTKIDFISCRNLLIYLQPVLQKKILSLFRFSLNSQGYMFLGSSETAGVMSNSFLTVNEKWRIYRGRERDQSFFSEGIEAISSLDIRKPKHPYPKLKKNAEDHLIAKVQKHVLENHAPSSIVVDGNYQILYTFGNIKPYLNFQFGKATLNILNLVSQELAVSLSSCLKQCSREQETVVQEHVFLPDDKSQKVVNITVEPLRSEEANLFIIIIEENKHFSKKDSSDLILQVDEQARERILFLEQELVRYRENLQAVVEEQEATNEELQSMNEELVASNEELQSTNEELQSVNEELYTVNTEYQVKIEELLELNNDMNNLLANHSIGTIFLDTDLCIRKYTPAITEFINIIESDVGRKFSDLSHNLEENIVIDIMQSVLIKEEEIHMDVLNVTGREINLSIRPYLTEINTIKGLVITFVNKHPNEFVTV